MSDTKSSDCCPPSKWTVMIYFAADNDLDDLAFKTLHLMKEAGSNPDVNIIAQLDTRGIGKGLRYRLRDTRTTLEEDLLPFPEAADREPNTGDPGELSGFLFWAMKEYKAENYMLVIWGHGQGWTSAHDSHVLSHRSTALTTNAFFPITNKLSLAITPKMEDSLFIAPSTQEGEIGSFLQKFSTYLSQPSPFTLENMFEIFGFGDPREIAESADINERFARIAYLSKDFLDNEELRKALDEALKNVGREKLAILAFDACLMGMAETGYQIKDQVNYLVASEDATPRGGWPYNRIFEQLKRKPDLDAKALSLEIIRQYVMSQQGFASGVTLSSCNLYHVVKLKDALKELVQYLKEGLAGKDPVIRRNVMTARAAVQSYYLKGFVDLYDFCEKLRKLSNDLRIKELCEEVMMAIYENPLSHHSENTYVYAYGFEGVPLAGSHGVSIYFPNGQTPKGKYKDLTFVKDTEWYEFLETYLQEIDLPDSHPMEDGEGEAQGDNGRAPTRTRPSTVRVEEGRPVRLPVPHHTRITGLPDNHPCSEYLRGREQSQIPTEVTPAGKTSEE